MIVRPRIIPTLLLDSQSLVKTIKFKKPTYLGDPINAVKIFNEMGVDELCLLDISATKNKRELDFDFLKNIASEAFMPLSYGGGINSIDQIQKLFSIGFEKVIINTAFVKNPQLVEQAASYAGSQSIVVSIDYKKDLLGEHCYIGDGMEKVNKTPLEQALYAEKLGAGEILLYSMSNDGMMHGYDINTVKNISTSIKIPLIACGGAGNLDDLKEVLEDGQANAVAAGSMFVYFGSKKGVLINFPNEELIWKKGIFKKENHNARV